MFIAMITPLYADTLPYVDIWFLEKLMSKCANELRGKSLFAIGQCGFPDITRIDPPLATFLNNNARKQAHENGNVDFKKKVYLE